MNRLFVAGLGYAGTSETRKGYTGYEKDTESGLDFAQARYYSSVHGRYTSVDPLTASATIRNPQTFNRYIPVCKIRARTLISRTPNLWRKSGARAGRS